MKSTSNEQVVAKGIKWLLILAAVLLLAFVVGLVSIALVYLQSGTVFEEAGVRATHQTVQTG